LKVKEILVTGHYGCGGVRAAFKKHDHGPLEAWLSHIRDIRARHKKDLVLTTEENENLLTELNVKAQVYNISKIPIVQLAWKNGQELRIHGFVYDLRDGLLKDLGVTLDSLDKIPEEYRVIE
jgi:carbonic anhydrase